jgi:hypothetical protein
MPSLHFDNVPMIQKHCTHSWLGAFAARLLQLRPGMSLGSAVHCAVQNIHQSAGLDPTKAAEICAHNDFFSNAADARGSVDSVEAQSKRYRELFAAVLSESTVASRRAGRRPSRKASAGSVV